MVKPKFTPDPPPNIDGLPVEDQVRMLLDHMQRTHNRIEDWWPKDFENRIQALEGLVPYKIGPWVMVSLSSMDWVHEVYTAIINCNPTTATFDSEESLIISPLTSVDFNSVKFDADLNRMYAAQFSGTGNGQGVTQYSLTAGDLSTLSYVGFSDLGTVPGELFTAIPGNLALDREDGEKFIVSQGLVSGSRYLRSYQMSTPWDITTSARTSSYAYSAVSPFSSYDILSMVVSADGEHVYATANYTAGSEYRFIFQWDLSTPWDVSTASYVGSQNVTDIPGDTTTHLIRIYYIDDKGQYILTTSGYQANLFIRHELSTPFDITSQSFEGTLLLSDLAIPPIGGGIFIAPGCDGLYALDVSGTDELQYYTLS